MTHVEIVLQREVKQHWAWSILSIYVNMRVQCKHIWSYRTKGSEFWKQCIVNSPICEFIYTLTILAWLLSPWSPIAILWISIKLTTIRKLYQRETLIRRTSAWNFSVLRKRGFYIKSKEPKVYLYLKTWKNQPTKKIHPNLTKQHASKICSTEVLPV